MDACLGGGHSLLLSDCVSMYIACCAMATPSSVEGRKVVHRACNLTHSRGTTCVEPVDAHHTSLTTTQILPGIHTQSPPLPSPFLYLKTFTWSLILSNSSMHTTPRSARTMAPASKRFSPVCGRVCVRLVYYFRRTCGVRYILPARTMAPFSRRFTPAMCVC